MQLVHGLHRKRQPAVGRPACGQLQHRDAQAVHVRALAMPVAHARNQQLLLTGRATMLSTGCAQRSPACLLIYLAAAPDAHPSHGSAPCCCRGRLTRPGTAP